MSVYDSISIHVLREEDDRYAVIIRQVFNISIHVLREEDDRYFNGYFVTNFNFYPRPPRGGRLFRVFGGDRA